MVFWCSVTRSADGMTDQLLCHGIIMYHADFLHILYSRYVDIPVLLETVTYIVFLCSSHTADLRLIVILGKKSLRKYSVGCL